VHNYIKECKLRQWIKTCNQLCDTYHPNKFWKRFNVLTSKNTKTIYPLLQHDQPVETDKEKANAFAFHLQEIFTPLETDIARNHSVQRFNFNSPELQPCKDHRINESRQLTAPITSNDICQTIEQRKNTPPGIDGITYRHIKEAPPFLLILLAAIYTFILRTGNIQPDWKTSKTLMNLKPCKPSDSEAYYRPIQLTPTLRKNTRTDTCPSPPYPSQGKTPTTRPPGRLQTKIAFMTQADQPHHKPL